MSLLVIQGGKIVDSLSTVPINTIRDVTASRAIDGTLYTNNTGKTMWVVVCVLHKITLDGGNAYIGTSGSSWTMTTGLGISKGHLDDWLYTVLTLPVEPGKTYSIPQVTNNGTNQLLSWTEMY